VELEAEEFLEIVYGDKEGWIDLPAKVESYWVPFHTEWPADGEVSRRIDSSLRDREDLYYSVAQFAERGRRIEDVLPASWLWADLDEVHPTDAAKLGFLPTVAVESSPGRHQALWRLDRELKPASLERLNRALSYALDADKGGWDLTQVLRIPGTRNFKYAEAPIVRLMWYKPELVYDPRKMWSRLKAALPPEELIAATTVVIPKTGIPAKAKRLLRTQPDEVVEGERSARLWELECLLAESGLGADEIFDLVWPCAWNKHRSVRTGRSTLAREIKKAIQKVSRQAALKQREAVKVDVDRNGESPREEDRAVEHSEDLSDIEAEDLVLPFVRYSSFMSMRMEEPKWLVRDIWTAGSHGIIGGEPKTSKTTLALALGLSVASGRPFLGKYPVGDRGPVLFVQEENAPWMVQDRLRKLAWFYGLIKDRQAETRVAVGRDLARKGQVVMSLDFPSDLPFRLLNNFGFDLGEEEHRIALWNIVEEYRPKLVVLDPLYLTVGDVDTDKVYHLRPVLRWLLQLRYEFGTAIILVHHMRKQARVNGPAGIRAGQNLMGSAILHGWVDSALYARDREIDKDGWKSVVVEREFRSMAPQRSLEIDTALGEPGTLSMKAEIRGFDIMALIARRVSDAGSDGLTARVLAEDLGMDVRTLLSRVRGDEEGRVIVRTGRAGRGHSHRLISAESEGEQA
jgi:hypothetical protein